MKRNFKEMGIWGAMFASPTKLLKHLKSVKSKEDLPADKILEALAFNIWKAEVRFQEVLKYIMGEELLWNAFKAYFMELYEPDYLEELLAEEQ